MRELSAQLGYAKLTDSVRSVVKELVDSGNVELIYPERLNRPDQKIRLTRAS